MFEVEVEVVVSFGFLFWCLCWDNEESLSACMQGSSRSATKTKRVEEGEISCVLGKPKKVSKYARKEEKNSFGNRGEKR